MNPSRKTAARFWPTVCAVIVMLAGISLVCFALAAKRAGHFNLAQTFIAALVFAGFPSVVTASACAGLFKLSWHNGPLWASNGALAGYLVAIPTRLLEQPAHIWIIFVVASMAIGLLAASGLHLLYRSRGAP